jgi:hypothetical protein
MGLSTSPVLPQAQDPPLKRIPCGLAHSFGGGPFRCPGDLTGDGECGKLCVLVGEVVPRLTQRRFQVVAMVESSTYSQMSDEELFALANADLVTESPVDLVTRVRNTIGRKFEVTDITHSGAQGTELYDAACEWLKSDDAKNHGLDFVRDIARKYARGGGLTDMQARGILNCMSAQRPSSVRQIMAKHDVSVAQKQADKVAMDDDDRAYEAWLDHTASAIGQGHYTVVHLDGTHTTVKVGKWNPDRNRPGRKIRWISYLSGSNNESDYTWFARQGDGEGYVIAPKHRMNGKLGTSLRVIFHEGGVHDAAKAYALESGRCARCNRLLTHPESILVGYGEECLGKVGL